MKQTEIGLIPDDWKVVKLSQVTEIKAPMVNPKTKKYAYLPHIGNENIEKFSGKLLSYKLVGEENLISGKYYFKSTDVLYGKINPQFSKVAYPKFEGLCSADMYPLSANYEIIPEYLKYTLLTKSFYDYTVATSARSGMPKVNRDEIAGYQFALPTINEQKKITKALSDIDSLICGIEEEIEKKKNIKIGAMQELLTGKRRLPGFEKSDKTKMTELGEIPEDWEVRSLGEIGFFKNGISKDETYFGHGSPFVNLLDVFGKNFINSNNKLGLIDSNESEQNMYSLQQGDILFVRSSVKPEGVGLTTVVMEDLNKTVYAGFLLRFRERISLLDLNYKKYAFDAKYFRNNLIASSTVSANTNINQPSLRKLLLILPTKEEQTAIARILSDMDEEINKLEEKFAKYQKIKNGMMQQLLTGKIRLYK